MTLTLGIDIGTYESKGVLVNAAGRVVAQAARPHRMHVPRPGWAEHRPEAEWWGDTCALCRELLATSGRPSTDIAAVALSAIGPCLLPVDVDGAPLRDGILYGVDTRAAAEIAEMTEQIGAETILERCGNALTSQSVGPKILWLKRHEPEVYAAAATFHTSTSFVVHRLTGARVIDHYTAANFSPLYDAGAQDWVQDLAPGLARPDQLPRLMWSHEIAGTVTARAAEATGLAPGTLVTVGTIDAGAEALSVGVRQTGDMMLMYGSTIFIILLTDARVRDGRLWTAPWLFPGRHAAMAGLATSGTLTHWFRDQLARELPREAAFATLAAEAAEVPPGAEGLLCLPYFSGERTPIHDPHASGTFFGLTLTHTRAHLYRALIEGIAHGTAHVTDTFAEAGAAPARVLAVGGGTKNALWLQATSDLTGLPQVVPRTTLGASYGNAFLARLALGEVAAEDIARWNPPEREVTPERHAAYDRARPLWRRLYAQTKDIMHDLSG